MRDPLAAEVSFTAADGTRLVGRRIGQGSPVILVHGSAGGLDSWDPVVPLLADEFELWVYARRGYAPSGDCPGSKTFADDVADLEAVLAATGGRAHVVGASYGAAVALHAARGDSHMIRSVALFEPPLFAAGPVLGPVLERYRALIGRGDLAAATRVFAEEVSRVPPAILRAVAEAATPPRDAGREAAEAAGAVGCLHDLEAMATDDLDIDRWTDVRVPVLLIQGADTWAPMPATMQALAGALPEVSRVVLEGQAHFATHTAPAPFAQALRRFLRDRSRHPRTTSRDTLPEVAAPARRALHNAGFTSLGQLAGTPRAELAALHGMGPQALRIIEEALEQHGLRLA